MSRHLWMGVVAALSGIAAPAARAQTDEVPVPVYDLPTEEVSAYRIPVQLRETTQGVSVISEKTISARNPASAVELFQQVPGLQIDQVGNAGGQGNIYIRGSEPNHTLILIDGVRLNDPTNNRGGGYDLSSLDPSSIERIEVIRGAGSAIYGADAMGGIVNIVTKRGKAGGVGAQVRGEVGGQGYRQGQGSVSFGNDRVQGLIGATLLKDGDKADGGEIDLKTFHGSVSFQPTKSSDIRLYARHNDRDSSAFPESSGGVRLAVNRDLEKRDAKETIYGADFSLDATEKIEFNLKLASYKRDEDKDTPAIAPADPNDPFTGIPAATSSIDFERRSVLVSALFRLPLNTDLSVGYEQLREVGEIRGVLDFFGPLPRNFDLTRKTRSPFAEVKLRPIEPLVVHLGVRRDSISDQADETSPSAGVRFTIPGTQTTLKAHYAEGFKPPSFFALGDPISGNPDLLSETSKSTEIGFEQGLWGDRASISAALFKTKYKNLIDFDFATFKLVNRNRVNADGAEVEFKVRPIERLSLGLSYTYVDLEIENSNINLRNRPKHRASLSLNYAITDALQLAFNAAYVGKAFDSAIPTGEVELDSYTRVDAALTYRWRNLSATFALDNLLNDKYEQFIGFEQPGIRARVGVGYRF
jgi:vitamin B12 transporter